MVFLTYLAGSLASGIFLAEFTLKPPRTPLEAPQARLTWFRRHFQAYAVDASIESHGDVLRAWYIRPRTDNGNAVFLLHGVGDNRLGAAGFAEIFLAAGYRVLLPDSRAHGESGGTVATYGLLEREDTHSWTSWLAAQPGTGCIYGLGESMGGAILLQSLAVEQRFCGVIAESSFSSFREVAYDRMGMALNTRGWFGHTIGRLPVEIGLLYARVRYHINLDRARPLDVVRSTKTPILLIHGAEDVNILPRHSELLHQANPASELWIVPRAQHTGAWAAAPGEFERRVMQFFQAHPSLPQ